MVSFKSMKKSQELSQWVCDDDRVSNQSLQKCNFIYIFFFKIDGGFSSEAITNK